MEREHQDAKAAIIAIQKKKADVSNITIKKIELIDVKIN